MNLTGVKILVKRPRVGKEGDFFLGYGEGQCIVVGWMGVTNRQVFHTVHACRVAVMHEFLE